MIQDEEKFKERYQLLLDNRQIFLFFFASAVILALVFSLGVVVGRRLGTGPAPPPPSDPLALLDRMSKEEAPDENLTFHEELSDDKPAHKPAAAAHDAGSGDGPTGSQVPKGDEQGRRPVPSPAVAAKAKAKAEPPPPAPPAKPEPPPKAPEPPSGPPPGSKGKFTLQLSSFQDRQEAAQFVEKLRQEGLKPFMIAAKIPGRGVWYRVRVGIFDSWEEALAAKESFEKRHKVIAYVARH
jgi:cell division septation protein DedD